MNQKKAHQEWVASLVERARRHNRTVPNSDILFLEELSGPDGAHFTLIVTTHTQADIEQAKRTCRNLWDATGFTIVRHQCGHTAQGYKPDLGWRCVYCGAAVPKPANVDPK